MYYIPASDLLVCQEGLARLAESIQKSIATPSVGPQVLQRAAAVKFSLERPGKPRGKPNLEDLFHQKTAGKFILQMASYEVCL